MSVNIERGPIKLLIHVTVLLPVGTGHYGHGTFHASAPPMGGAIMLTS